MDEIVSPVFRDQGGRLFRPAGPARPRRGLDRGRWRRAPVGDGMDGAHSLRPSLRHPVHPVGTASGGHGRPGSAGPRRRHRELDPRRGRPRRAAARPLAGGDRLGRARIQCLHRQAARHSDAHQRDRRAERGGKRRARLRGRGTVRDDDPDGRVHGIAQDQRGPAADRHGRIRGRTVGHTRGGRLGRRQDQGPVRGPRRLGGGPGLHFRGGRFGPEAAPRAAGRRRVPGEGRGRERQGPGRGQRGAQGHSLLRRRRARHGRRDRGRQREDQPARHERGHRGGAGGRAGKGLRGGRGGDPQARRVDRQQCPVDPLVHRGGGRPRGRGLLARRALRQLLRLAGCRHPLGERGHGPHGRGHGRVRVLREPPRAQDRRAAGCRRGRGGTGRGGGPEVGRGLGSRDARLGALACQRRRHRRDGLGGPSGRRGHSRPFPARHRELERRRRPQIFGRAVPDDRRGFAQGQRRQGSHRMDAPHEVGAARSLEPVFLSRERRAALVFLRVRGLGRGQAAPAGIELRRGGGEEGRLRPHGRPPLHDRLSPRDGEGRQDLRRRPLTSPLRASIPSRS